MNEILNNDINNDINTDVDVKEREEVLNDKITSAKILQSTKDIIETLNLKGNQQEKLDSIVRNYKQFLDEVHNNVKEEVIDLSLLNEFEDFSKELDVFVKKIELKVNKHLKDTIITNNSNLEKDLNIKHNNFINLIKEIKDSEDAALVKANKELLSSNEDLLKENKNLLNKNDELTEKIKSIKIKYEDEREVKNALLENVNSLRKELEHYRTKDTHDRNMLERFGKLEALNEKLKKQNEILTDDSNKLLEKNKEIAVLKEQLAALNANNNILSNTLNTINNTISSLTQAKVEAEEKAIKLKAENEKLLKALKNK